MTIFFNPGGRLNISTDSADLPEQGEGGRISSDAMTRCKNLRLDRDGMTVTRRGSSKLNSTAIGSTVNHITEQAGVRYEFTDDFILRDETLLGVFAEKYVEFTTSGTTITPVVSHSGTWYWSDGSTSVSAAPTKTFTTSASRTHYFVPADWAKMTSFELSADSVTEISGLDNFTSLATLNLGYNSNLKSAVFIGSSLRYLYLASVPISQWDLKNHPSLWYVELPTKIGSADFSNCTGLSQVKMNSNNAMGSIDMSAITGLSKAYLTYGVLSSITLPAATTAASGYDLRFTSNNFGQTEVDYILATIDGWANNSGNLDVTLNAIPSAAGLTSKSNLEGRGWTVQVDS